MSGVRVDIPTERLGALCQRWKIAELSLFGSAVRDDFRPDSDVDVLVTFGPGETWSLLDLMRLREELRSVFGREVDLVEEAALRNPFRRQAILRDKRLIHAA